MLFGVPLTLAAGLFAAVLLNRALGKLQGLFRVGYYLPVVTSIVAIAVIWRFLLQPETGLVNAALGLVGIDGPNWLGRAAHRAGVDHRPRHLAELRLRHGGLPRRPPEHRSRALRGGAGSTAHRRGRSFRHITLPLLKPAILFLAIITSSGYLQLFEEPFVLTGGGPLDSTLSVSMYIYEQGFRFVNFGYASAIAYALFVAIIALAAVQFRVLRSET